MSDDSGWVVEPASEVQIEIAVGEDAELTPEVREALDSLLRVLESEQGEQEVEAYRRRCPSQCAAPAYATCNPKGSCAPQVTMPCFKRDICNVGASLA